MKLAETCKNIDRYANNSTRTLRLKLDEIFEVNYIEIEYFTQTVADF